MYNILLRRMVHDTLLADRFSEEESWHVHYKYTYHVTDYLITSIERNAAGVIDSAIESLKLHIEELESQIKQITQKIASVKKEVNNMLKVKELLKKRSVALATGKKVPKFKTYKGSLISEDHGRFTVKQGKKDPLVFENAYLFETLYVDPYIRNRKRRIHQFEDRLRKKQTKLQERQSVLKNKKPGICFGSKATFKKQFTMPNTPHTEWGNSFRKARERGMMLVGRADGYQGNYMCKYNPATHILTVRTGLTLDSEDQFDVIEIPFVEFPYGQGNIEKACAAREAEKLKKKLGSNHQIEGCFPQKPVTWTIYRRGNDFQVYCTITVPDAEEVIWSIKDGVIAFDSNYDNLAVTELDASGNMKRTQVLRFDLEGCSSKKNENILSEALEQVFKDAMKAGKPVVMEDLSKIKSDTLYSSSVRNRHSEMFAYKTISDFAERKGLSHILCKLKKAVQNRAKIYGQGGRPSRPPFSTL